MSKKPAAPANPSASRAERVLGGMVISTIGLTILSFVAIILGTGVFHANVSQGIWPVLVVLPLVALPLAFIFIVSLIALNFRRRRAEASSASR